MPEAAPQTHLPLHVVLLQGISHWQSGSVSLGWSIPPEQVEPS